MPRTGVRRKPKASAFLAGYKESTMLHIQEVKGNGKLNELYPLKRLHHVGMGWKSAGEGWGGRRMSRCKGANENGV